jgi:hypothetical protein
VRNGKFCEQWSNRPTTKGANFSRQVTDRDGFRVGWIVTLRVMSHVDFDDVKRF